MSSGAIDTDSRFSTTNNVDELMTREHKDLLAAHRDDLVSNMYPDDLLNRLQSRKVLNSRDVTRIKEKTAIPSQVELLLDTLMRKPDRAFTELVDGLIETDQNHVAKILTRDDRSIPNRPRVTESFTEKLDDSFEEDSSVQQLASTSRASGDGSSARKRKAGTVRVAVSATDVHVDDSDDEILKNARRRKRTPVWYEDREKTLIQKLNVEILELIDLEMQNYRKICSLGTDSKQLAQRKVVLESLKELSRQRREVTGVYEGSVIICVTCSTVEALRDLLDTCNRRGRLHKALRVDFVTKERLSRFGLKSFDFRITINTMDYRQSFVELTSESQPCISNKMIDLMMFSVNQLGVLIYHVEMLDIRTSKLNSSALQPLRRKAHFPKLPLDYCVDHALTTIHARSEDNISRLDYHPVTRSRSTVRRLSSLTLVTPPLERKLSSKKTSISPDSGISSLPSPISLADTGIESNHTMTLRSRRSEKLV